MGSSVIFNRFLPVRSFDNGITPFYGKVPVPVGLLRDFPAKEDLRVFHSRGNGSSRPGAPVVLWGERVGARFAAVFPYVDTKSQPFFGFLGSRHHNDNPEVDLEFHLPVGLLDIVGAEATTNPDQHVKAWEGIARDADQLESFARQLHVQMVREYPSRDAILWEEASVLVQEEMDGENRLVTEKTKVHVADLVDNAKSGPLGRSIDVEKLLAGALFMVTADRIDLSKVPAEYAPFVNFKHLVMSQFKKLSELENEFQSYLNVIDRRRNQPEEARRMLSSYSTISSTLKYVGYHDLANWVDGRIREIQDLGANVA